MQSKEPRLKPIGRGVGVFDTRPASEFLFHEKEEGRKEGPKTAAAAHLISFPTEGKRGSGKKRGHRADVSFLSSFFCSHCVKKRRGKKTKEAPRSPLGFAAQSGKRC